MHVYCAIITTSLIITYFTIYSTIKRLHDINLSSWFSIIIFIPIVNILFLVQLIFTPSYKSENRYGETSALYSLNLYGFMGLFLELSIILGLIFSTMNHFGYIKMDTFLENKLVFTSTEKKITPTYKIEEKPQSDNIDIKDTRSQEMIQEDVDESIAFLDNINEKEVSVDNLMPKEIEISNSIQGERLLANLDVEETITEENLLEDMDTKKTIEVNQEVEIVPEDIDSQEIVTLSSGEEEQRLTNIYLEDKLNKEEPILKNINYEEVLPKKKVEEKIVTKKIKKYQLYLITIPYRSKISFVDKDLTYKENMELLPSKYKIKVEKKGYKTEYRTIDLNNDLVVEFFLKRNS